MDCKTSYVLEKVKDILRFKIKVERLRFMNLAQDRDRGFLALLRIFPVMSFGENSRLITVIVTCPFC